jgi:hypothetical protein
MFGRLYVKLCNGLTMTGGRICVTRVNGCVYCCQAAASSCVVFGASDCENLQAEECEAG